MIANPTKPRRGTVAAPILNDAGTDVAGFICAGCGCDQRFPSYVLAHWSDVLTFTCECGTAYELCKGRAKVAR